MLGIIIVQLGSPASPSAADVRVFLKNFLGDPRVVDYKSIFWKVLLYGYILPFRPKKVAKAYANIWDGETFPLFRNTENFKEELNKNLEKLGRRDFMVEHAYLIGQPDLETTAKKLINAGCQRLRFIYQFPQYSEATTLSAQDSLDETIKKCPSNIDIEVVPTFHSCPAYIESLATIINENLKGKEVDRLLLSFHGYPLRRIFAGDDYYNHCIETAQLLAERIDVLPPERVVISFQSKFGREDWLTPGTEEKVKELCQQGVKKLAVSCPSFTVDNLETDDEIAIDLKEQFMKGGGETFIKVPCLNDDPAWVESFTRDLIKNKIEDIPKLKPVPIEGLEVPEQAYKREPLSPEAKLTIKSMFIVLILDLIGFSIIFPLFPEMLEHYQMTDGPNGLFAWLLDGIHRVRDWVGGSGTQYDAVIFGGALGSIYSLLQFICAPLIGSLSDRFGRKPVLVFSIAGIALSYSMWFFAGSFAMLVISRILGGIMSGNISTATAVVADVTQSSNRSRGMATIGIAFGLGFIFGPVIGAFAASVDLTKWFPELVRLGVNPFSTAALVAFLLSVYNLYFIVTKFKESLPAEKRHWGLSGRSVNPIKLFRTVQYPGVTLNNFIYFLFLLAFSGMEFTLTFLTAERFAFGHMNQGWMFLYIGLILAFMQGGYVRRKAHDVGEKKMAGQGMLCVLPGLMLIGFAPQTWVLFLGLFFLAVGSAQVMPCLTSLASIFTPEHDQGRILGIFRSLGALSRVLGPITAGFLYWKFGSQFFYIMGGLFMVVPFLLLKKLPPVHKAQS